MSEEGDPALNALLASLSLQKWAKVFADEELSLESESLFKRLLAQCVLTGPGNTIRGGTIEILRSVASKGLQGLPA